MVCGAGMDTNDWEGGGGGKGERGLLVDGGGGGCGRVEVCMYNNSSAHQIERFPH